MRKLFVLLTFLSVVMFLIYCFSCRSKQYPFHCIGITTSEGSVLFWVEGDVYVDGQLFRGRTSWVSGKFLKGYLGSGLWNRAFSKKEVEELYYNQLPFFSDK